MKINAKWIRARISEPSTYAGVASVAIGVADIAQRAQGIAATFKDGGALAGSVALMAGLAAILKPDTQPVKNEDIINGEFTEVKDKK